MVAIQASSQPPAGNPPINSWNALVADAEALRPLEQIENGEQFMEYAKQTAMLVKVIGSSAFALDRRLIRTPAIEARRNLIGTLTTYPIDEKALDNALVELMMESRLARLRGPGEALTSRVSYKPLVELKFEWDGKTMRLEMGAEPSISFEILNKEASSFTPSPPGSPEFIRNTGRPFSMAVHAWFSKSMLLGINATEATRLFEFLAEESRKVSDQLAEVEQDFVRKAVGREFGPLPDGKGQSFHELSMVAQAAIVQYIDRNSDRKVNPSNIRQLKVFGYSRLMVYTASAPGNGWPGGISGFDVRTIR